MKAVLVRLVKEEIAKGHDIKEATDNIVDTWGSDFKRPTIRNYYRAFAPANKRLEP